MKASRLLLLATCLAVTIVIESSSQVSARKLAKKAKKAAAAAINHQKSDVHSAHRPRSSRRSQDSGICCSAQHLDNHVPAPALWEEVPFVFYGPITELRDEVAPSHDWEEITVLGRESILDGNEDYYDDDYFHLENLPFPFCLNGSAVEDEVYVGTNPYLTFLDSSTDYDDFPEYPDTHTLFLGGHDTMMYALYRLDTEEKGQLATVIRFEGILYPDGNPDAEELYGINNSYIITEVTFFEDNTIRVASGADVRFRNMTEADGIDYTDQFMTGITAGDGRWIVRGDNDAPNPPPHVPGRAVLYSRISGCDPAQPFPQPVPTRRYQFRPDSFLANDGSDGPAYELEVRSSTPAEAQSLSCNAENVHTGCFSAVGTGKAVIPALNSSEYSQDGWTVCMWVRMEDEPYTFFHWGGTWAETYWYLGYVESFGGYFFPTAKGESWEETSQFHVAQPDSTVYGEWRHLCWVVNFAEGADYMYFEGRLVEAPFRYDSEVALLAARDPFAMTGMQDIELGSSASKTIQFADVRLYSQPLTPAQVDCAANQRCEDEPGYPVAPPLACSEAQAAQCSPVAACEAEPEGVGFACHCPPDHDGDGFGPVGCLGTEIPSRRSQPAAEAASAGAEPAEARAVVAGACVGGLVVLAAAVAYTRRRATRAGGDSEAYEVQTDVV